MTDFKKINDARKILGLGESATLYEIKDVYRKLSLKYHPDKCEEEEKAECEETFKKISSAYETIMTYCANYRFSFAVEEVQGVDMDKEIYDHMKRFYDGWFGDLS
ncbi:MAG: DnaJ domain-containing protein [Candidatus Omnitrophica bacterium]|nr:DnaJ domain-containing protein [Candidatus Omnitrophota bacterium]